MPMNVKGRWGLAQSNGLTINLSLTQDGGSFSGEAEIDASGVQTTEPVAGTVTDEDITFKIGSVHYLGTFTQGRPHGLSIDFADAVRQSTWFAPKTFSRL
ncbi:hypothetical protein DEJ45_25240 [Streptomyces venezuelae]|uniref:hypothetical protein n=1 Tax=Streptomyces venezuelae TaxID=54571 RepID=UPI00123D723C|nr:hypothetical protein [Streptomyces venezuelae]QES15359.1 hypothetical protein DEJ45_25240 [Streptomyces venezuelae]